MSTNDADEVLRLLDAIIRKLGCAIGSQFSSSGSADLLDEVKMLREKIEGIVVRNTQGDAK